MTVNFGDDFQAARAIAWSGFLANLENGQPGGFSGNFTETGVVAVGYKIGSAPTEQDVIDDNSLGGFASVSTVATTQATDGSGVFFRIMAAFTRSDGITAFGAGLITPNPQVARIELRQLETGNGECGVSVTPGPFGFRQTITISGDASAYRAKAVIDSRPLDPSRVNSEEIQINASVHREITALPAYWNGPSNFDICSVPVGQGQYFIPRPPPSASADPNQSAIDAALGLDPLRGCRGCGQ